MSEISLSKSSCVMPRGCRFLFEIARAREECRELGGRSRGALNLAEQRGDAVDATFAHREWCECFN
jgi:hypothetical protein